MAKRKIYGVDVVGDQSVSGAATVGGTLGVTGAATVGGTLGVTGDSTLASASITGNASIGGELTNHQLPTTRVKLTANATAVAGQMIHFDTSGGAFTVTMPVTPADKDTVGFLDIGGVCSAVGKQLTITAGARKLMGLVDPIDVDLDNASFYLEYDASIDDWRLK